VRIGCGCLLLILIVLGGLAGATWTGFEMLQSPVGPAPATGTREDAVRAQQKIYGLVARTGRPAGRDPVVITEAELNAFVDHNLVEVADVPLSELSVRLVEAGVAEFRGRLPLRDLLGELPAGALVGLLARSWAEHRVWVEIRTDVRAEAGASGRRYLRLDPTRFSVGRRPLPTIMSRLLLDPSALRWMRWSLPAGVEDIRVEEGRVAVRTAG
jgi:hypothetical protein